MDAEHATLLEVLAERRKFLRTAVHGLTDEQAALRSTVSELCLGGLIKHVANVEEGWAAFAVDGAEHMEAVNAQQGAWEDDFTMLPGETLAGLLERYEDVAARTDALIGAMADLDISHELPKAPWFAPGVSWSVRRVVLHLIGETAHHSGHADILRETIDGAKTMG
jgi:hypothetical protein